MSGPDGRLGRMCGRYATTRTRAELMQEFDVDGRFADLELPASYNVAPTQTSAVVLERPPRDEKTAAPVRQLRNLKWGLLPVYAILLGSGLTARMGPLLRRQARRPLRRMVSRRCLGSALMCLSTWDRCP